MRVISRITISKVKENIFGQMEGNTKGNGMKCNVVTAATVGETYDNQSFINFWTWGNNIAGDEITKKTVSEINAILPLGFRAESDLKEGDWGIDNKYYQVLFLICAVIYCICSALFENLKQPVYIICMLPISFIGIFLIFSFSDFYFDQGGFACFIMLSGLVTNSSILLVNEFNSLKHSGLENNRAIIRAIANRGRTISLITTATCCSIIPFLFEGQKEVFWFSFSLGTLGGLIFSFFAVFFVLPTLLWKKYF